MNINLNERRREPLSTSHPLTKKLIFLLALAGGVSVANLYYSQPLLVDIANTFHMQSYHCGGKCGLGYRVTIKKVDHKWVISKVEDTWIS
jgi:hypothetical protein